MHRGFTLQSTYRIEGAKPVVLIYGKLESGGSFLIRDTRQIPSFHIRRADADRARRLGAIIREEEPPKVTLRGDPAARVEVQVPGDVPPLREKLAAILNEKKDNVIIDSMKVQFGKPNVKGARVTAEVVEPEKKGPKVIAFKFRRREGYHRKRGIRAHHTVFKIKVFVVK
jgi:large subunit ribosomal protein L21